jgi:hypothetical protein
VSITTYLGTLSIVPLFVGMHGVLAHPIWAEPLIIEDCSFLVVGERVSAPRIKLLFPGLF